MSKAQPRLELDRTRELPVQRGLPHAALALSEMLRKAVKQESPVHRFLDERLVIEAERREERRVRTSLRLSGLPLGRTPENRDWSFRPSIDRRRVETLAT